MVNRRRTLGWVAMSERDVQRIRVLSEVLAGRRTTASAAALLAVSSRQARRLRLVFAPPVEAAQGNTEFQQLLKVSLGEPGHYHRLALFESPSLPLRNRRQRPPASCRAPAPSPHRSMTGISGSGRPRRPPAMSVSPWLTEDERQRALSVQQAVPQFHQLIAIYSLNAEYYPLAPWAGLAVECAWAAAALALAYYLLRRRDA